LASAGKEKETYHADGIGAIGARFACSTPIHKLRVRKMGDRRDRPRVPEASAVP